MQSRQVCELVDAQGVQVPFLILSIDVFNIGVVDGLAVHSLITIVDLAVGGSPCSESWEHHAMEEMQQQVRGDFA